MNDIYQQVREAEVNLDEIRKLMATWTHAPLFQRHDGKADNLLEGNGNVEKRNAEIKEAGGKIFALLEVIKQ